MNTTPVDVFTEGLQTAGAARVGSTRLYFSWLDYTIFGLMLLTSALIGAYFGFWVKKKNTVEEYLHGGKAMGIFPISISIAASSLSGVILVGTITEVYMYGTLYWLSTFVYFALIPITYFIYLPVFYDLKIISAYEYLELRFNANVRRMASAMCTIYQLLYIPIVLYVPALTFSQVSGIDVHIIAPAIGLLCIFYTVVGGIKAVVWTDFLQGMMMFVSSFTVMILGVMRLGGLETIWRLNAKGGRLQLFEWSLSPFVRHTTLNLTFGKTLQFIGVFALNQAMVQRYLSLPTLKKAGISIVLSHIGMAALVSMGCFTGLLVYALYADCDPLKTGVVKKPDQLVSLYVMEVSSSIPGLPGLYISGILSAALSTMSSSYNSLGATIFEDFIRPILSKFRDVNDSIANNIMKITIILFGLFTIFMVYIIEHLGSIVQVTGSIIGVTNGAMIGIFTFGMFFPRGNAKGALAGSIVSFAITSWVVFGAQIATSRGSLRFPRLNTSTEGCDLNYSLPITPTLATNKDEVFLLYRLSYINYSLLGLFIMLVVGTVVSLLTEAPGHDKLNPKLFTPFMRKYVERRRKLYAGEKKDAQELQNMVSSEK